MMCTRRFAFVTVAFLALAGAGVVFATTGSGVSSAVLARAHFLVPVDIKVKVDDGSQQVIHVPDTQDTVIQQIIIQPGGQTGWHSHPGPAIALVKSGALTLYDGDDPQCLPHTYQANEGFVDSGQGHVHIARNLNPSIPAEVWVTYLDVPSGQTPPASPRIDQPSPGNCQF